MKIIITWALCLLCFAGKAQIDFSDTSTDVSTLLREKRNTSVYREIFIYAYNDSVTVVDSPYLYGAFFFNNADTFTYVVFTWLFYYKNGKILNSIWRGIRSNKYSDYQKYLNEDMLWEIWLDRGKRDYWLYSYAGRKRISFKH